MVTIHANCGEQQLQAFSMQGSFARYASYQPIVPSKAYLVNVVRQADANVTVAVDGDRAVVGVAVLEHPQPDERWHRVGEGVMMEVSVIEVSRKFRGMGVSRRLLAGLVETSKPEDHILFMVGYSWTWDLEGAGLTAIAYRNMMIRLFAGQGFRTYQTNEPNIMMRPENLFMARVGDGIPEKARQVFKLVRFNMDR